MKKLYVGLGVAAFIALASVSANAQTGEEIYDVATFGNTTGDCDTINYPVDPTWRRKVYKFRREDSTVIGFYNGTSYYQDKQKANFFELSGETAGLRYISSVRIAFNFAYTPAASEREKDIIIKVLADDNGKPGAEITRGTIRYGVIIDSVQAVSIKENPKRARIPVMFTIPFNSVSEVPADGKFYVSVDFSNLTINWQTKPELNILATRNGIVSVNTAWTMTVDGEWHSNEDLYSGDTSLKQTLYIFPVMSSMATGCEALPVKLLSFNATRNAQNVTLNWRVAGEYDMDGYVIERADNNNRFVAVGSVKAINNLKDIDYSFTDKNAFANSSTVQYRLKQVNADGSSVYSRIIPVKSGSIISDIVFANPFNGDLTIQMNLASAEKVSFTLINMQGATVAQVPVKTYGASANKVVLNNTSALQSGVYILKVTAGNEQSVFKVVKQ